VTARRPATAVLLLLLGLVLGGCGDDGDGGDGGDSGDDAVGTLTSTTLAEESDVPADLAVVVTNDDGYAAPGIDALVEGLRAVPGSQVTVVAPADDRTGTGGRTTEGALTTSDVTTASGFEATAVQGYPADTVRVALDDLGLEPDVIVSGINKGQNLGVVTDVSGTVGAAKAAAARGVPSLAVSAGQSTAGSPDYATAAAQALSWLEDHREELAAGEAEPSVTNMNVPTCPDGSVREQIEVPVATESGDEVRDAPAVECASSLTDPDDDVEAFNNGYVTLSELEAA
jgi:5'-nucleotidase